MGRSCHSLEELDKGNLDCLEEIFDKNMDVKVISVEGSKKIEMRYRENIYHIREYIYHHEQSVATNMNDKDVSSEVLEMRNMLLHTRGKVILVIKWQKNCLKVELVSDEIEHLTVENLKQNMEGVVCFLLAACYRLNFVPVKFIYFSLNPQCNGIWRLRLWEIIRCNWSLENEALMMGLVPLYEEEETPGICLHHVKTQWEGSHLQARKRALIRNWISQNLDLELLATRTMKK